MKSKRFDESLFLDIREIGINSNEERIKIKCGIVKFLNICKLNDSSNQIQVDGYFYNQRFIRNGWFIPIEVFIKSFQDFQENQLRDIQLWNNQNDLFKLIEVLRIIDHKNILAKRQITRSRRTHFYIGKNKLLDKAIKYSMQLAKYKLPFFEYGKHYDETKKNYEIVLFFQIGHNQISFHTNDYEDVKDFPYQWNQIINQPFPFNLKEIKTLIKNHTIPNEIKEKEIKILSREEIIAYIKSITPKSPPKYTDLSIQKPIIEEEKPSAKKKFKSLYDFIH